jgi:hypothetical protein
MSLAYQTALTKPPDLCTPSPSHSHLRAFRTRCPKATPPHNKTTTTRGLTQLSSPALLHTQPSIAFYRIITDHAFIGHTPNGSFPATRQTRSLASRLKLGAHAPLLPLYIAPHCTYLTACGRPHNLDQLFTYPKHATKVYTLWRKRGPALNRRQPGSQYDGI